MSTTTILTRTAPAPAKPRARAPRDVSEVPTRKSRRQLRATRKARKLAAPNARALDLHVRSADLWPRTYR